MNDAGGWYRLWNSSRTALREYGLDWTNLGAAVTLKTTLGPLGVTWGVHGSDFGSTRDPRRRRRSAEPRQPRAQERGVDVREARA
ncbi:MAG: hypothetical protein IPN83_19730 [Holophagales bacterium]|nr:hypothetical protein [Holophagales bacterium]